jgi:hypothetical protein
LPADRRRLNKRHRSRPGDPSPNGRLGGLIERIVIIEILAWYTATGWRIFRES